MLTNNAVSNECRPSTNLPSALFDHLSSDATKDLVSLLHPSSYRAGAVLFSEKDPGQRVFVVLEGEVKLSMNSSDGRRLILNIARKGEFVGVASVVAGQPYQTTAETLYPCKLASLSRNEFLSFLGRHPEVCQSVMEDLSRQFSMACEQLRTVGLSNSAPEKLARLLLDWSENGQPTESGTRFRFSLTHGEIGEFIGTSRETVTRTLSSFKSRHLVDFQGSMLTISNRTALESFARG
jgi:CRP/FNR family transcriptional regulator